MSRRPTAGLLWPLPTMSNACSSGTPAFIIVASCRVNSVMSFSLIEPPSPERWRLTRITATPWRRRVDCTTASPLARMSPFRTLPVRSRPSHEKVYSLTSRRTPVADAVAMIQSVPRLLIGDRFHLFEGGHALFNFEQARLAQIAHTISFGLLGDVDRVAVGHDDPVEILTDRHHLIDAGTSLVTGVLASIAPDVLVRRPAAVQVRFREPGTQQCRFRDVERSLARRTQLSRQTLRSDQDHRRGDVERSDTHVHQARQRRRRVVRVQR